MDFKSITKCSQINNVLQCQCKTQKSVNASGHFFFLLYHHFSSTVHKSRAISTTAHCVAPIRVVSVKSE